MHPELSLVLLTVLASAGQGLFILTVLVDGIMYKTNYDVTNKFFILSLLITLCLQGIGMLASTFHLGKPMRGWKAIKMWKNSWLSREIIKISAFTGCAVLYGAMLQFLPDNVYRLVIGCLGIGSAFGFFVSSAMVYGSMRYIKEWSNGFTPINFVLFGLTSGFALGLPLLHFFNQSGSFATIIYVVEKVVILFAILSLITKIITYKYNSKLYNSTDIKSAIGINDPNIKLMDMGTSYDHYNTKEFYHPISAAQLSKHRNVIITAFVCAIGAWLLSAFVTKFLFIEILFTGVGAGTFLIALLVERYTFFIEGNHVQNLYYGNFKTNSNENPLVIEAKKGTPLPN